MKLTVKNEKILLVNNDGNVIADCWQYNMLRKQKFCIRVKDDYIDLIQPFIKNDIKAEYLLHFESEKMGVAFLKALIKTLHDNNIK